MAATRTLAEALAMQLRHPAAHVGVLHFLQGQRAGRGLRAGGRLWLRRRGLCAGLAARLALIVARLATALIAGFFLLFVSCGIAFGTATGTVRGANDVTRMMRDGIAALAPGVEPSSTAEAEPRLAEEPLAKTLLGGELGRVAEDRFVE